MQATIFLSGPQELEDQLASVEEIKASDDWVSSKIPSWGSP